MSRGKMLLLRAIPLIPGRIRTSTGIPMLRGRPGHSTWAAKEYARRKGL
jgi:hypothetical protein